MGTHRSAFSAPALMWGSKLTRRSPSSARRRANLSAVMLKPWRVAVPAWVPNWMR